MDDVAASEKFREADERFREARYDEALEILRDLAEEFPGNRQVKFPLAKCLAELGQFPEALELCQDLIDSGGYEPATNLKARIDEKQSSGVVSVIESALTTADDLNVMVASEAETGGGGHWILIGVVGGLLVGLAIVFLLSWLSKLVFAVSAFTA